MAPSSPRRRRGLVLAGIIAAALVVAGGVTAAVLLLHGTAGTAKPLLTDAEATATVQSGLRGLQGDMASAGLGSTPASVPAVADADLSGMHMVVRGNLSQALPFGGQDGPGDAQVDVNVTFGRDAGSVRIEMAMHTTGLSVQMSATCTSDGSVVQAVGQTLRRRPSYDGTCGAFGNRPTGNLPLANATIRSAHDNGDGTLTAVALVDGNETSVHMTRAGSGWRLTELGLRHDNATMNLTLLYGPRSTLTLPAGGKLAPADVTKDVAFEPGNYTWTAQAVGERVLLSDLEVRVERYPDLSDSGFGAHGFQMQRVATFELSDQTGAQAGFSFQFHRGGGTVAVPTHPGARFSLADASSTNLQPGDSFTILNPDWQDEYNYTVEVYDKAAGGTVGYGSLGTPTPGVPVSLVAVLGAAVLVAVRRRDDA